MAARILLCLLAAWLAVPAAAREQSARVEDLRLLRGEGQLLCDLDLTGLFPPAIEGTLRSGLPVVIDVALELHPEAGEGLGRLLRSEVSYDVWEDRYSLRRGEDSRDFADFAALRAACRDLQGQALADWEVLQGWRRLSVSLRVAVNPLGGAERKRMARWLAKTVSDPSDPANRELRLDLGALIGGIFGEDEQEAWGPEHRFGPFLLATLPRAGAAVEGP